MGQWFMTFAYLLVLLSIVGLVVLLLLAKGYWFARSDQPPSVSQLLPIDVDAFRNLIDVNEELYLRERLPPNEFRRIHRERMLAAVEYVRGAYGNAGVLVRIAQTARDSADAEIAEAAGKLFNNAVQLRWYALQVIPRFYVKAFVPGIGHAPDNLFDRYELLTRQALVIRRLGALARNA